MQETFSIQSGKAGLQIKEKEAQKRGGSLNKHIIEDTNFRISDIRTSLKKKITVSQVSPLTRGELGKAA